MYVCYRLCLFLRFFYWILELPRKCGIFLKSFINSNACNNHPISHNVVLIIVLCLFVRACQDGSIFSGVRVTRSLVLCVCFVDRCLFFCTFSFWPLCCLFFDLRILITPLVYCGHCVVCSLIYGF